MQLAETATSAAPVEPTGKPRDAAAVDEVARQLLGMRRVMRQLLREALTRIPLSDDGPLGEVQYFVLYTLGEEAQLTAGDLADRCHVADPTISRVLNQLEANGLVVRRTDPSNRRVVQVTLTPAGRSRLQHAEARWVGSLAQILSPLDAAQLADLRVAFAHLESLVDRTAREDVARPTHKE